MASSSTSDALCALLLHWKLQESPWQCLHAEADPIGVVAEKVDGGADSR